MSRAVKVAVEGCCHGELNRIYHQICTCPEHLKPDLLVICGDFQSLRDEKDLESLAVPDKYKQLGDFHEYYNGTRKAPVLTVFIGGNHEASNYLKDLQNGGWVCDNIYYMGYSNVIWYKGLRIGGISGIYKSHNFYKPHYETVPLNDKTVRSIYHTRFEDFLKLSMIQDLNINIMLSHDWPEGITSYGDKDSLLRKKPFFTADIAKGELGSIPSRILLAKLMPNWWFSAHLHVRFDAVVLHDENKPVNGKRKLSKSQEDDIKRSKVNSEEIDLNFDEINHDEIKLDLDDVDAPNNDEIELNLDEDITSTTTTTPLAKGFSQTNFLALDKCLPRRQFIEYLEIPVTNEDHPSINSDHLHYDLEFIKIKKWFKKFHKSETYKDLRVEHIDSKFLDQFKLDIDSIKVDQDLIIPENFEPTFENSVHQKTEYLKKFDL